MRYISGGGGPFSDNAGVFAWPLSISGIFINDLLLRGTGGSGNGLWLRAEAGLLTIWLWCRDPDMEGDVFLVPYWLVPIVGILIVGLSGSGRKEGADKEECTGGNRISDVVRIEYGSE